MIITTIALTLLISGNITSPLASQKGQGGIRPDRPVRLPNEWRSQDRLPRKTLTEHTGVVLEGGGGPQNTRLVVMHGREWLGGNKVDNLNVFQFNCGSGTWSVVNNNFGGPGRVPCSSGGYDMLLFGDAEGSERQVFGWNTQSPSLTNAGQLAVHRSRAAAIGRAISGDVEYFVFGGTWQGQYVNSIERYLGSTKTGTVLTNASLASLPMINPSAALMPSGKVFLAGSKVSGDNRWTVFDPTSSSTPFQGGSQNVPSSAATGRIQVAYSSKYQRLLVLIEPLAGSSTENTIQAFWVNPSNLNWTPAPVPPNPNRVGTLLLGSSTGFYLIGGVDRATNLTTGWAHSL